MHVIARKAFFSFFQTLRVVKRLSASTSWALLWNEENPTVDELGSSSANWVKLLGRSRRFGGFGPKKNTRHFKDCQVLMLRSEFLSRHEANAERMIKNVELLWRVFHAKFRVNTQLHPFRVPTLLLCSDGLSCAGSHSEQSKPQVAFSWAIRGQDPVVPPNGNIVSHAVNGYMWSQEYTYESKADLS